MIEGVTLKNFKCFENIFLEMSNLNVLSGINSAGKSTVIQSFLLLRQSYEMGSIDKGLHLNGEITNLGTGYDLLNRDSETDEFNIQIHSAGKKHFWSYKYNGESDFQKLIIEGNNKRRLDLNIFSPTFAYVSADRIGPKRFYEKSYHEVINKNQLGYRGELYADYIAERGQRDKIENHKVLHPNAGGNMLLNHTQSWLSEISPGVLISPKKYKEAGIVRVEFGNESFNPLNVGFGLSYIAPIIVCLLKAKKGDLIILENPEAHLHPKGQRKIGELIARCCAGGVQIVLETHSDHLLNGIRLAVKKKAIDRNLIRLNYFYQKFDGFKLVHKKCSPAILDDGSLSDWPDGFFDEWEKAVDELF